jgi:hypothetical protein
MKLNIGTIFSGIISFGFTSGCGSDIDPFAKEDDDDKKYNVCKYSNDEGVTNDNCVTAISENGTCEEGLVKVTSSKPANDYSCVVDL